MKKIFFILCLLLAIQIQVNAATWYLSPTGSNTTGDGSEGNPWLSPAKARKSQGTIAAGDTVIFKNGTYNYTGGLTCRLGNSGLDDAGTVENPITYKAETRLGVTIDFGDDHGWRLLKESGGSSANIVLDGFIIINTRQGVRFEDVNQSVLYSYITSDDTWPADNVSPVSNSGWGGVTTFGAGDNWLIDHCWIDYFGNTTGAHGIYASAGGGTIRYSSWSHNVGNGIQIQAGNPEHILKTVYAYGNKVWGNTDRNGIYVSSYSGGSLDKIYLYNNLVWDNGINYSPSSGITVNNGSGTGYIGEIYVHNNTVYDNAYTGINIYSASPGESRNNISVGNTTNFSSAYRSWGGTKSNNLSTAGTETNAGIIGSFPTSDFLSTDPTSENFLKLDTENNAIEAGYNLSSLFTVDHAGTTRSVPFDCGAYCNSTTDTEAPHTDSVSASESTITQTWSELTTAASLEGDECSLTCTGSGTVALTYSSGSGTLYWVWNGDKSLNPGETCTMGCTFQPGDAVDGATLSAVTFTGQAVSNLTPYVTTTRAMNFDAASKQGINYDAASKRTIQPLN